MRWPPFKHVIFDCDSTLTKVEGIDILAESAGKGWRVSVLTNAAMSGEVELEEVYGKRLQAIKPTRGQIQSIRQAYKQSVVPDAKDVVAMLQSLDHQVYIISGGLEEAVIEFGRFLGVPREHIRAVTIEYDHLSGQWWQADSEYPDVGARYLSHKQDSLTISDGKAQIIRELVGDQNGRSILIGDGVSDLLASHAVDLFVGFGGVVARSQVKKEAPVFINSLSLAPFIALVAGPSVLADPTIDAEYSGLIKKARELILENAITFQSEILNDKFDKAWQATH